VRPRCRRRGRSLAAAVALLLPCQLAGQATEYDLWYQALREAAPDRDRGAVVQNLMVTREGATFFLESGQIHLLGPVRGRTVGAVWLGEGRFLMGPPTAVERDQLRRHYESDQVDQRIRRAVFFFSGDADTPFPGVDWEVMAPPNDARREIEEALKYVSDDDGWLDTDLAAPLINDLPFFYAHVADDRGDPSIVMVTPMEAEGVSLAKRAENVQARETVMQFPRQEEVRAGRVPLQEELDPVRIRHFDFAGTIDSDLDFEARATLTFQVTDDRYRWIPLRLFRELEVDSARWDGGAPATFARPEESSDLWIDFGSAPSGATSLTVYYAGELIHRSPSSWVEVRSSTTWLPVFAAGRPATYRMTFRHDERLKVAAVGRRVQSGEPDDDDMVTEVWETPEVRWSTFNVGRFSEHRIGDPATVQLTVQVDDDAHRTLARQVNNVNDAVGWRCPTCRIIPRQQSDMAEEVGSDLLNSFRFYEEVFGPTGTTELVATEIPYTHGEAHSGLVLLSWTTFHWTTTEGFDEIFRAHEVAHQWWGIGVRPATYHDRWMSEGFAQFSGLWYMARRRGSLSLLQRHLESTREEIWDRRDEAGPIWLGTRAGSSSDPGDYSLTVYDKGAWVLHMLRVLLSDPDTGSDAAFEAMIKDFFATYQGEAASTEQFREVVERHVGIPMDWFFNQWVYGTAIPEYRFSYRTEELPSGEYLMTVRVRQLGVPDDFQMLVPIYLDFGVGGDAQVNIAVVGPETELELPLLPMEPEDVVFNPSESVLAEVREERWRD